VAYYQLNKDFIAQTLCENQDKPAMQCEGNCFLSKQLKNLEDKQDAKKPAKDIKAENLVYLPAALQKNQPLLYITSTWIVHYLDDMPSPVFGRIFQPPATAVFLLQQA
jgi:hypothetical protein